jgi:hypothetical protein
VEGSYEHGNEPSNSINCWVAWAAVHLAAFQYGLRSIELVAWFLKSRFFFRNYAKDSSITPVLNQKAMPNCATITSGTIKVIKF